MATAHAPVAAVDDLATAALAAAPVLLWHARPDGMRDWLAPGWSARLGRAPEALLGDGWLQAVHPEDASRWRGIVEASASARAPYELDLRVRSADGRWRWMLEQGAPRLDPAGALLGYAGACIDIETRKRSEERLAERTQMLRLAERRQAQFLGLLSHALRNPLAPIGNAASVLRTLEDGQPVLARLREILERQVARLGRLIDDLVDATRAAQGRITVVNEPLEVAAVVRAALAASADAIDAGGHHVELRLPDEPLALRGDARRLSQALSELVDNAARFTHEPATIDVEVRARAGRVRIAVRDPGQGIDAAFLPHVFELFAQEERGHGRRARGLGVGLTLARRIAQLHGGELIAASRGRGQGALFTLELPLAPAAARPRAPSALDERFRVLVVDRDPGAGEALRTEMEQ
jgi:PAS domain S-box-containing protein